MQIIYAILQDYKKNTSIEETFLQVQLQEDKIMNMMFHFQ